jgi:hypothetical protein
MISVTFHSQGQELKRKAFKLEIAADEAHQYTMDVKEGPYFVKEKILQIYCNETLFIECEVAGDSISKMKVVEENTHPERTIVVKFSQNADDRKNIRTDLHVKNPFDKQLKYNALMFTPTSSNWKRTSIIPVLPKIENFEMWPHSIISLVLDKWRFE